MQNNDRNSVSRLKGDVVLPLSKLAALHSFHNLRYHKESFLQIANARNLLLRGAKEVWPDDGEDQFKVAVFTSCVNHGLVTAKVCLVSFGLGCRQHSLQAEDHQ